MNKRYKEKRKQKQSMTVICLCLFVLSILIVCLIFVHAQNHDSNSNKTAGNAKTDKSNSEEIQNDEEIPMAGETQNNEEIQNAEETQDIENSDMTVDNDLEQRAKEILLTLSLEEKVAQLFIVLPEQLIGNVDRVTAAGDVTREAINKRPVGGIIYLSSNLISPQQTKTMTDNVQQYSLERLNVPMFLCVDEEGGQVTRLAGKEGFNLPIFDNMSVIGSQGITDKAREIGESIGQYLYDLGFNTDFAPVADVLSNPQNQVVQYRSFGDDPEIVKEMTNAVSHGLASQKILSAYKHFPGHGDTTEDTHQGYAYSNKTKEELYQCELIPFINGIENDVSFIMVGHISFPNIVGDNTPASLSKTMVKDLLIDELHYTGIIITDALNMGAISQEYSSAQAAVKAVKAGVDMLLMPADFNTAYEGVLSAVKNGEISEERINESVYKILKTKMTILE